MHSKLLAVVLLGLVGLSANPAHAQGRVLAKFLDALDVFGTSAEVESRVFLAPEVAARRMYEAPEVVGRRGSVASLDGLNEWTIEPPVLDFDEIKSAVRPEHWKIARRNVIEDSTLDDLLPHESRIRPNIEPNVETEGTPAASAKHNDAKRFKFSFLDGKLKIGTVMDFDQLSIEGGEVNLYKWGAVGGAVALCHTSECLKALPLAIAREFQKRMEANEAIQSIANAKAQKIMKSNKAFLDDED